MLYVCIYAFMNMGAFGVVIMLRRAGERGEEIADFAGLGKTNKTAAFLMLIFLFSLTGIPPLAGFMGKFYIFKAAMQAGLVWLAVAGVIFSAISAYFYLRVIMVMYMSEPKGNIRAHHLAVPGARPGDRGHGRCLPRGPSDASPGLCPRLGHGTDVECRRYLKIQKGAGENSRPPFLFSSVSVPGIRRAAFIPF